MARACFIALMTTATTLACDDDFPRPSRVDSLRVLAIRAEPPELEPGGSASIEPLVVAPGGVPESIAWRWRTCILPLDAHAGGGFDGFAVPVPELEGDDDGPSDCAEAIARGEPYARELGDTPTTTLTVAPELFDDDRALRAAYALEGAPSDELRHALVAVAGLPVRVELTLTRPSGETLVAAKSVRVMRREDGVLPNTNPPAPAIALLKERDPSAAPTTSTQVHGCLGRASELVRGGVTLVAALDLPAEHTRYPIVLSGSTTGAAVTRLERSELWSYSLFATAGRFALDAIESEPRPATTTWRLDPTEHGAIDLWVVLRDGRGGTSWCHHML